MTSEATCLQCQSPRLTVRATYQDFVDATQNAADSRRRIYAYMKQQAIKPFRDFIRCRDCGMTRVLPAPTPAMLQDFYQDYYANSSYAAKREKKIALTHKRLARIRKYISSGTFLDVGANVGFAVEGARQCGFTATGIEIDAKAVAYASEQFPENRFFTSTIEDFTAEPFDLVHCTEVIEHTIDPVNFVSHLARLTKPGGYLFLTTPDGGHWRVPRNFVSWPACTPLEHINWQTRKSIRLLLNSQGFKVLHIAFNLKSGLRVVARRV